MWVHLIRIVICSIASRTVNWLRIRVLILHMLIVHKFIPTGFTAFTFLWFFHMYSFNMFVQFFSHIELFLSRWTRLWLQVYLCSSTPCYKLSNRIIRYYFSNVYVSIISSTNWLIPFPPSHHTPFSHLKPSLLDERKS